MITNLHHVAILTGDLDAAVGYYVDLLGCQPAKIAEVDKPGLKFRSAMLPIGAKGKTFLQILEPAVGPGVKELAQRGEGALFEMAFESDDIEAFADELDRRGIAPSNTAEDPIEDKYIESKFGNRYFIVPGGQARQTRMEFVQMMGGR